LGALNGYLSVISEEDTILKSIAEVSPNLAQFVKDLQMRLSRPQQRHANQIADGLIIIEGDKNLSNIYRHFVGDPLSGSFKSFAAEFPRKSV
jgi:hypothetical protein